jgi:antitoxin CcdA
MLEVVVKSSNDKKARRQSVNLTANSDLVRRVREENGVLSALFEESMLQFLSQKELKRWKDENRKSFESYNKMIAEHGLFSEDMGLL